MHGKPIFIFHALGNGGLNCFHYLAIINNAPVNICIQVFVLTVFSSLVYVPTSDIVCHVVFLCFTSWSTTRLLSKAAVVFYIPPNNVSSGKLVINPSVYEEYHMVLISIFLMSSNIGIFSHVNWSFI